jgi:hypothetical protein
MTRARLARRPAEGNAMTEPAITPELIASHGIKPDEWDRLLDILGASAKFHRTGHLLGHVERALLLQIVEEMAADAADDRATGDLRAGRECRCCRYR